MSEPDVEDLEQLHHILEEAGTEGIRLDKLLDSLKIDHGNVDAIIDLLDRLAALERNELAYQDIIQTREERGISSEIRWFSGKRPKGRTRAFTDPGFFFFFFLY